MLILLKNNRRMEHIHVGLTASKHSWLAWWSGAIFGVIGKLTLDNVAVILSIISFTVAICYTIWKWVVEYKDRQRQKHNY